MEAIKIDHAALKVEAEARAVEAKDALGIISKMEIHKPAELEFAVAAIAEVKTKRDAVDAQRKRFVDPLRSVVEEINAFFRPALDSLSACEKALKERVEGFVLGREADRRALIEAAGQDGADADKLLREADGLAVPKIRGLSLRRGSRVAVHDERRAVEWLATNRPDLLQPNTKAMEALAKSGTLPKIPGVTVSERLTVAVTSAKVKEG